MSSRGACLLSGVLAAVGLAGCPAPSRAPDAVQAPSPAVASGPAERDEADGAAPLAMVADDPSSAPSGQATVAPPPAWPAAPAPTPLQPQQAKPVWSVAVDRVPGPRALHARHGTVVALTWQGQVVALDGATGRSLWRAEPQATGVVGNEQMLAVSDRSAVLANEEVDQVVARGLSDGRVLWQRRLAARPVSMGSCRGYRLTALTHRAPVDGKTTLVLHGLDSGTGATLWQHPAAGRIVGSGAGLLFLEELSDVGRLASKVTAYRCEDGRQVPLAQPPTRFVSFLEAEAPGVVLLSGFDFRRVVQQLCVVRPGRSETQCVDATAYGQPGDRLKSAALRGRYLYLSMGHLVAHNLDPTPDSAVTIIDLATGAKVGRTGPMVANGGFVDAGALLLTAMGGTGARDFAHLIDPADGRIVRKLPLPQAATAMAADEARAYVASRSGRIYAVPLPLPGPAERPARTVAPRPSVRTGATATPVSFSLEPVATFDAHPPRGVTSGQPTAGTVGAVAFLGPDGRQLAAGGNDDRVRVFDLDRGGAKLWQSSALGKDITGLAGCRHHRLAARSYGGIVRLYRRTAPGAPTFRLERTFRPGHSWMFGLTEDCQRLVSDTLQHQDYRIYEADSGGLVASITPRERFDRRGTRVRAGRLAFVDGAGRTVVHVVDGTAPSGMRPALQYPLPLSLGAEKLVQVWAIDDRSLLTEYCSAKSCIVRFVGPGGRNERQLELDVRGSVWVASVPSDIDVSADGAYLSFFRDGLDMQVIRVETDERRSLGALRRTMSSTPMLRFSPFDPRLLAVTMHPKPHQVTVMTIRDRR